PGAEDTVRALLVSGDAVVLGGWFSSVGGQRRSNVAALDLATGALTGSLGTKEIRGGGYSDATINAIDVVGTTVYIGGSIALVDGSTRNRLYALHATTGARRARNH